MAGFGDGDNNFARGDYQKSTKVLEEIEKAYNWRDASRDLLEEGRMAIDAGSGDEECDRVGWNFIRPGLYLQPNTIFFQPRARFEQEPPSIHNRPALEPEEEVTSITNVRNPDLMSFCGYPFVT